MNTPNPAPDAWFKSTYSQAQGECVEVAFRARTVAARDSKDMNGPVLEFTPQGWTDFLDGLDAGDFRP
ncbi:DUF397 domain-containing protein [Streptomyces sp. NBC_01233]|uniref:DUF397 domain-containing protein n=1 Tax=Streptomyces sp. NBC_01233 TaxID=2903787 RepID=UPI002E10D988|nr:DUF397 domain-containing protein [Streptomyces sp. NBC_01233]